MPVLLWITRATGLVPGWCWAIVVAVLAALCVRLDVGMARALADAAQARTQLLQVQLASRDAIAVETERAAARVRTLTQTAMEAQDALAQSRQTAPARAAALTERLRDIARPVHCAGASPAGGAAAPAVVGDGQPHPGLPGMAGAGVVVLDGQALTDLADLAESAADTGRTLTHARRLLRACWQSGAVPAAP